MFIVITTAFPVTYPHDTGSITVAGSSDVVLRCRATGEKPLTYQWMRISLPLPKFKMLNKILMDES